MDVLSHTPGNPGVDYVGWDNTTTVPLNIRHNGSEEIRFYTDNRVRLNLNPDRTNTFGSFTVQTNGFLGLGSIVWPNTAPLVPWTRFHMQDDRVAYSHLLMQQCFRDWMRNGTTMTSVHDQFYLGQMAWDDQDTHSPAHAVFQWGKNNPNDTRPSLARFIYAGEYTGTASGEQSRFGKELMQLHPDGYIGLGDWNAASVAAGSTVSPGERLDVLDGKVRIRQLPSDATSASTELVTVNMTTGMLEHKPAAALPDNCEWAFDSPTSYNVVTASGTASGCPGDANAVWVGGTSTDSKLYVENKRSQVNSVGIKALSLGTNISGNLTAMLGQSGLNPTSGSVGTHHYGVVGRAYNGSTANHGLYGDAIGGQSSYGLWVSASGGSSVNVGGSLAGIGGTDCAGVSTSAKNGTSTNTGIYASASGGGSTTNIGGKFPSVGGVTCYGILASATGGTVNNYAGYFSGSAYATTNFVTSDENLKNNVQELEGALSTVLQIHPKTYDFRTAEYPSMHLPAGRQAGVIAQDLEEVLPALVADAMQPAEQDEEGNVTAAVDFKAVNMAGLIPYLIGAIQEQQARIDALTAEVEQCCAAGRTNDTRSSVQDGAAMASSTEQLTIAPNPFTDRTVLTYTLSTPGRARLEVGDTEGRRLSVLREEQARAGTFRYEWDTQALAAGTYLVTLLVDDRVMMKKAVKVAR